MHYELAAKAVSIEEDEDTFVLAFADEAAATTRYVMLQYPLDADERDAGLGLDGLDGLYIERDDQGMGCYRGVAAIRRSGDRIEIELTDAGVRHLQASRITVTPLPWQPALERGLARLAELARGDVVVSLS